MFIDKKIIEKICNKAVENYNQCVFSKENDFLELEIPCSLNDLKINKEIIKLIYEIDEFKITNIEIILLLFYEENVIGEYKYIEDDSGNIIDDYLIFY